MRGSSDYVHITEMRHLAMSETDRGVTVIDTQKKKNIIIAIILKCKCNLMHHSNCILFFKMYKRQSLIFSDKWMKVL